jgi:hypothetical protein
MRLAAMRAVSFCSAIPALLRKVWIILTRVSGCGTLRILAIDGCLRDKMVRGAQCPVTTEPV